MTVRLEGLARGPQRGEIAYNGFRIFMDSAGIQGFSRDSVGFSQIRWDSPGFRDSALRGKDSDLN